MKTLYFECMMGAAGDMLMGALLDLIEDKDAFITELNALFPHRIKVGYSPVSQCGVGGIQMNVAVDGPEEVTEDIGHHHKHPHHSEHEHPHPRNHEHSRGEQCDGHTHSHTDLEHIKTLIRHLDLPEKVKEDIHQVYMTIARAESRAHGKSVAEVHFHEVGSLDALADITGVCMLMHRIAPESVCCSPVITGFGHVKCAHGILPVPAPATALLLERVPTRPGSIEGELCTPTGAALLLHFTDYFGEPPVMIDKKIGYGFGKKEFPSANCVRAFLGNTAEERPIVHELCCTIDDMTPEAAGYALRKLLEGPALDAYFAPVQMKRERPGIALTVLCRENDRDGVARLIFEHTTTAGIRDRTCERMTLDISFFKVNTRYGDITVKEYSGFGVRRHKPEYKDVECAANHYNVPLRTVLYEVERALSADSELSFDNPTVK